MSQSTNAPRIKPSDKERERDLRRRLLPKYDAEEEEEEVEGYSIDENGVEWFEDEDGYWWFREEGQDDWQPYDED